uniref:(northern house mosquito) hypothetical protein n=1 Tax=Culex pipiens TaxID=7175 RepID=A0A8D8KKB8_CULPI
MVGVVDLRFCLKSLSLRVMVPSPCFEVVPESRATGDLSENVVVHLSLRNFNRSRNPSPSSNNSMSNLSDASGFWPVDSPLRNRRCKTLPVKLPSLKPPRPRGRPPSGRHCSIRPSTYSFKSSRTNSSRPKRSWRKRRTSCPRGSSPRTRTPANG